MRDESAWTRPVRIEDAAAVACLSGELGYPSTPEQAEERIRRILREPGHRAWVAVHAPNPSPEGASGEGGPALRSPSFDGTPVGWIHAFVSLRLESSAFVEIGGLVVSALFRGRGVGRSLLETAEAWAGGQGIRSIRIRSRVSRTDAHRFYEKFGYTESKEQKVFAKEMRLPPPPA
ncbi:MAG: GNAT family N-acetyltransferase [Candidatus Eisenbacteria bacterium]|nr:GNAT family N-acetyltransferase [Candidatus Eisenbacteria bacterium]